MSASIIAKDNLSMCKTLARAEAQKGISESDYFYLYEEFGKTPIGKYNTFDCCVKEVEELMTATEKGELEPCDYYVLRVTRKLVSYHAYLEDEREDN